MVATDVIYVKGRKAEMIWISYEIRADFTAFLKSYSALGGLDLGGQLANGDELRFTPDQFQRTFWRAVYFSAPGVCAFFVGLIEALLSAVELEHVISPVGVKVGLSVGAQGFVMVAESPVF